MTKQTVIIDVSGGVAYVTECPDGIEVIIRDWDNCTLSDDDDTYCIEY